MKRNAATIKRRNRRVAVVKIDAGYHVTLRRIIDKPADKVTTCSMKKRLNMVETRFTINAERLIDIIDCINALEEEE